MGMQGNAPCWEPESVWSVDSLFQSRDSGATEGKQVTGRRQGARTQSCRLLLTFDFLFVWNEIPASRAHKCWFPLRRGQLAGNGCCFTRSQCPQVAKGHFEQLGNGYLLCVTCVDHRYDHKGCVSKTSLTKSSNKGRMSGELQLASVDTESHLCLFNFSPQLCLG